MALREADAYVLYEVTLVSTASRAPVVVGNWRRAEFVQKAERQRTSPQILGVQDQQILWWLRGKHLWAPEDFNSDDVLAEFNSRGGFLATLTGRYGRLRRGQLKKEDRGLVVVHALGARDRSIQFSFLPEEFDEIEHAHDEGAVLIGEHRDRGLWWYEESYWWETDGLTPDEVELAIWDRLRRHEARFDRLRKLRTRSDQIPVERREPIPADVRASSGSGTGAAVSPAGPKMTSNSTT
jgi:hypothetical protein